MNIFSKFLNTDQDFIAIGDMVIDAFIRLKDAHKTVNQETNATELCMVFGTKLPFEFAEEVVAVGNSANAAVAAARIGLRSGLVAHVGKDENGEKCIKKLKEDKVDTQFIGVHPGLVTNYHYVLWYGDERTILIKHENFPLSMPAIGAPKWLYLSSLGEQSLPFHKDIIAHLNANPSIKLVFQPGTYQIKFGVETLSEIYKRSDIFFCNLEEAQTILSGTAYRDKVMGADGRPTRDITVLLAGFRSLGVKLPVITDGPQGAYTYMTDAANIEKVVHMDVYPDIAPPYERTGAGDAFASTFSSAIALGKSIEVAMKWGSINSMNVCQKVGAQKGLLTLAEIEDYLKKAPAGWELKTV